MNTNKAFNPLDLFKSYVVENAWREAPEKNIEFTEDVLKTIITAIVVAGKFGNSVKVRRIKDGKNIVTFIPLSINSTLQLGQRVDCSKCRFICLEKEGCEDIYRFEEK